MVHVVVAIAKLYNVQYVHPVQIMTEVNIKSHPNADNEFLQWTKKLEQLAQSGVKEEIAQHKALGRSIFYSRNGVLIMELADGRCFEYQRLEDGTREIVREVDRR